jgi:hypothetical protein
VVTLTITNGGNAGGNSGSGGGSANPRPRSTRPPDGPSGEHFSLESHRPKCPFTGTSE